MPEIPSSHLDLLDAPWATLATIDREGRPQLSQVAFLAEDGAVRVSLNTTREKGGSSSPSAPAGSTRPISKADGGRPSRVGARRPAATARPMNAKEALCEVWPLT